MATNLTEFGLAEMLRCSRDMHRAMNGAPTMETATRRICEYFYNELSTADPRTRACALVRCYKTHPYGQLEPDQQRFVRRILNESQPPDAMKCLTLLATVGDRAEWNSRHRSNGHKAIPLPSPSIVEKAPMIAQLIRQFGLDLADVIEPSPAVAQKLAGKSYGVFHIEDAVGSPYIPAQEDFVLPERIRSVIGIGGSLATGDLFALILFCRCPVTPAAAERFRSLGLHLKGGLFSFGDSEVFDSSSS